MTRDEAIELRLKHIGEITKAAVPDKALREITSAEIDFYIETGMLKVDVPMDVNARISVLMGQCEANATVNEFKKLLETNGLKIVEK